jgi:hypothetical protein
MDTHSFYTCRQQESTKQVHCLLGIRRYKDFDTVFVGGYSHARYLAIPTLANTEKETRTVLGALFNVKGEDVRIA